MDIIAQLLNVWDNLPNKYDGQAVFTRVGDTNEVVCTGPNGDAWGRTYGPESLIEAMARHV